MTTESIMSKCWEYSLDSLGYNYIFNQRINKYSKYNKWLKFFFLLFPILIGLIAVSYEAEKPKILDYSILIAVPLTILQTVFALFAIVNEWDNELGYANEASQNYRFLCDQFKKTAENPPSDLNELTKRYELLKQEYSQRLQQDSRYEVKEWEKRKGMRYGLRQYQKQCVGCSNVPMSAPALSCAPLGIGLCVYLEYGKQRKRH